MYSVHDVCRYKAFSFSLLPFSSVKNQTGFFPVPHNVSEIGEKKNDKTSFYNQKKALEKKKIHQALSHVRIKLTHHPSRT